VQTLVLQDLTWKIFQSSTGTSSKASRLIFHKYIGILNFINNVIAQREVAHDDNDNDDDDDRAEYFYNGTLTILRNLNDTITQGC